MSRLIILDNEAVQALRTPTHPKHNQVLSHVQVVANRKKRAIPVSLAVPTAVRAEAGWDRTSATWAFPNHLRIADISLDAVHANTAAVIRNDTGVSIADAHIGAAIEGSPSVDITVITSDPDDIRKVAGDRTVGVVAVLSRVCTAPQLGRWNLLIAGADHDPSVPARMPPTMTRRP